MSADNGVYILVTKDKYKQTQVGVFENTFGEGIIAYRVAHTQAIDNFEWYETNELHNLGNYMNDVWHGEFVFYSKDEAYAEATRIAENYSYLEYGIQEIDATKYNFPGY